MVLALALGFWQFARSLAQDLYDWAVAFGGPGLFVVAAGDSSFLSLPESNDILIVILSTGQTWQTMIYYVSMTILGSASGCSVLYSVGRRSGNLIRRKLVKNKAESLKRLYSKWGIWAIFIPAILPPPMPFKIFVLSAGLFRVPFFKFLLAVILGRSVRYFTWGALAVLYGRWAQKFLENNVPLIGVALAVVLGGSAIVYIVISTWLNRKLPDKR